MADAPLTPKQPSESTWLGHLHDIVLARLPEAWRPWFDLACAAAVAAAPVVSAWLAARPH